MTTHEDLAEWRTPQPLLGLKLYTTVRPVFYGSRSGGEPKITVIENRRSQTGPKTTKPKVYSNLSPVNLLSLPIHEDIFIIQFDLVGTEGG